MNEEEDGALAFIHVVHAAITVIETAAGERKFRSVQPRWWDDHAAKVRSQPSTTT